MNKYRILIVGFVALTLGAPALAATDDNANKKVWDFTITLDGQPVGKHTFVLTKDSRQKNEWQLVSTADFVVTLVGVPVFRYHHEATEGWKKGCLARLKTSTNHDGEIIDVMAHATPKGGSVEATDQASGNTDEHSWDGCLMTFAYWNPDMISQSRLLNPETGEIEPVTITRGEDVDISVHGEPVRAIVWRIAGKHEPVDVLYNDQGEWVGLEATVRGGRVLSYRLQ